MQIWVVAVGPLRHPGLREAAAVYLQRLERMPGMRLQVVEVREGAGGAQSGQVVRREEGRRLLAVQVPPSALRVALEVGGHALSTEELARRLRELGMRAVPVVFYVGGAWGLDPAVLEHCPCRLSLSALTMAHEVSRLVLLEQLYRVASLLQGSPYAK